MINQHQKPLVVLGSSSSEVFDYIFGDHPMYYPYWASGWSARGLRNAVAQKYIETILRPIPADANIFLNFGNTDVIFNARHVAVNRGYYDFSKLLAEAESGISECVDLLQHIGFKNIICCFTAPPASLPQMYWRRFGPGRQLPDKVLGMMYKDFADTISGIHKSINYIDLLSKGAPGGYILKEKYTRTEPNHHPDYIKTQQIILSGLTNIPGILGVRKPLLSKMYAHQDHNITDLIKRGCPRPRTCV